MSSVMAHNTEQQLKNPKPLGNSVPKFSIHLAAKAGGEFEVRSCEVRGNGYRNRTSFQQAPTINEVFVSTVALGLKTCLAELSRNNEVVSLPEFKIEAPGLALGKAHILVSEGKDSQISIIVRFQIFLGNLDAVLCERLRPLPSAPVLLDQMASEVLFDITFPILNICSALGLDQISQEKELVRILKNLSLCTEDLKFRSSLLRRFLEDMSEGRCAQVPHFISQTTKSNGVNALRVVRAEC